MEWLEVTMEEYKTLRDESIAAMKMQQAVLRYGLAIVGVFISISINKWDEPILSGVLLLGFLPITCYLILMIWMGEVGRMMRAGRYLYEFENRINNHLNHHNKALGWENYLRNFSQGQTPQLRWNYLAILGIFLFFAVASIVVGNLKIWHESTSPMLIMLNVFEFIVLGGAFLILINTGMKFR